MESRKFWPVPANISTVGWADQSQRRWRQPWQSPLRNAVSVRRGCWRSGLPLSVRNWRSGPGLSVWIAAAARQHCGCWWRPAGQRRCSTWRRKSPSASTSISARLWWSAWRCGKGQSRRVMPVKPRLRANKLPARLQPQNSPNWRQSVPRSLILKRLGETLLRNPRQGS
jgi:hypothetical protein